MVFTLKRWLLHGLPSDWPARTLRVAQQGCRREWASPLATEEAKPREYNGNCSRPARKLVDPGCLQLLPPGCYRGFLGVSNNWAVIKTINIIIANCSLLHPPPSPYPYFFNKHFLHVKHYICLLVSSHLSIIAPWNRNCDFLQSAQRGWELAQDDRTEKWLRQTKVIWVPSPSYRKNLRWLGFKLWMDLT